MFRSKRIFTSLAALLLSLPLHILAQTPASTLPSAAPQRAPLEWDSVSIHAHDPNDANWNENEQPNGIKLNGVTVSAMLAQAYGFGIAELRSDQVSGLPNWARKDRYDVVARVAPDDAATYKIWSDRPIAESVKAMAEHRIEPEDLMLRNILEDRFHLKLHYEQRQQSVYSLLVDKGGPKLSQAAHPEHGNLQFNPGIFKGDGIPTLFLASMLSMPLQRTVVDRTGLTAAYDFELHYLPEGQAPKADSNDPDLFTALREQLGLRLEPMKGPVLVLVIDHIDPPTAN